MFYENYIGSIVDWYAATLFRREPLLTFEGTNDAGRRFFSEFAEDCDLQGHESRGLLPAAVHRGAGVRDELRAGGLSAVVAEPAGQPGGGRRRGSVAGLSGGLLAGGTDQLESTTSKGDFEWVVLRTRAAAEGAAGGAEWATETTWAYYDKEQFRHVPASTGRRTRRARSQCWWMRDVHGLAKQRRVPLFQLEMQEGLWLLNKAGSLQLEHFNKSNALSWALTMGLFAMPVIYSDRTGTRWWASRTTFSWPGGSSSAGRSRKAGCTRSRRRIWCGCRKRFTGSAT